MIVPSGSLHYCDCCCAVAAGWRTLPYRAHGGVLQSPFLLARL